MPKKAVTMSKIGVTIGFYGVTMPKKGVTMIFSAKALWRRKSARQERERPAPVVLSLFSMN